jgi:serine protease Do
MRSILLRPIPLFAPILFVAASAATALPAQGVGNPSLLRAQDDSAEVAKLRRAGMAGVFAQVAPSVVHVEVEVDGPRGTFAIERASSGVLVDGRGIVATWSRLVAEAAGATDKRIVVQWNDGANTRAVGAVVASDPATGLVLVQAQPPVDGVGPAALAAAGPAPGTPVLVVARPSGQEMLAFAGVASPALADVTLATRTVPRADVFLTDSRNDERCDGAPVFDHAGHLLGVYSSEHVQRDKSEPELADLKRPSFGVVLAVGRLRQAFAGQFPTLANSSTSAAHAFAAAVARVAPAVVSVWSGGGDWPTVGAQDPGAVQRYGGLGSGVVLAPSGLVVANLHVCSGDVRVRLRDGRTFAAKSLATNASSNLALLQLDLPAGTVLEAAACNAGDDVVLGEPMLAVGNPLGTDVVVTAGVVSARRDREGGRIQGDANLGNQNGGGAVVDATGRLLGIGDAGIIDAIDMAFAMRRDRATTESNLSTFVGIGRVLRLFREQLAGVAEPEQPSAAERALRTTPLTAMVARTSGAMLNIYVARNVAKVDEDDPFASMQEAQWMTLGLGSGVVIDPSGLAVSNWHVVDEAVDPDGSPKQDHAVTARVFGGKEYKVRVLSISREDDLSLLQLELEPGERLTAVELGSSERLLVGEEVAAIGNPHGRANTITFGIVSVKDQGIRVRGRWAKLENLVETDAAINGGNSGGALLDMAGRLVGINSAGGGTFNNKGYAIAVDHVRRQVLGLLFQPYKLRSVDLGMRVIDDEGRVVVMDVDPRGPAKRVGIVSGDRIVSIGGEPVAWSPGYALRLLAAEAGQPLALELERKGERRTVEATPMACEQWAVVRQAGLACRDFGYAEDPERVRTAAIALHRAFTGDAGGEPRDIPVQVVRIEERFAADQPPAEPSTGDLEPGDLLLAIELRARASGAPALVRIGSVAELRDWFNNRELGSYEGTVWQCWIARGGEVRRVDVTAKRLLW